MCLTKYHHIVYNIFVSKSTFTSLYSKDSVVSLQPSARHKNDVLNAATKRQSMTYPKRGVS